MREGADYRIRWFTPTTEVPLCGHATLASAAVVLQRLDLEPTRVRVVFHSQSGPFTVTRKGEGYAMNFPARFSAPIATPIGLSDALGIAAIEVVSDQFNYLALLESARHVRELKPHFPAIARMIAAA